jgi:hypothetical protein
MSKTPCKVHIQIALTPRQQRQIREATGREISTLELRLVSLPEPAAPLERAQQLLGSAESRDTIDPRRER